jgi:hypothetical protein
MTALQELLAKVEAGSKRWTANELWEALKCHKQKQFNAAFHGSLDAAKALHEAVLQGTSQYSIATDPTVGKASVCWWPDGLSRKNQFYGECWFEDNPARAWLIAIIKALIAQEATT